MPGPACPICGKQVTPRWRPFCSDRCSAIDLGRWFGETYRVPDASAEPSPEPPAVAPPGKPEE